MKIKVSELPAGSCFSRRGKIVKRLADGRCATAGKKGRITKGPCPSSANVKSAACPLSLLGADLPQPRPLVEMGSALPWSRRRGRRRTP